MSIYFIAPKGDEFAESQKIELKSENNHYEMVINDRAYTLDIATLSANEISLIHDNKSYTIGINELEESVIVELQGEKHELIVMDRAQLIKRKRQTKKKATGETQINSPMPGKVVEILVNESDTVKQGDGLIVIEAMKMENELKAPVSGTIKSINVKADETVDATKVLLSIE